MKTPIAIRLIFGTAALLAACTAAAHHSFAMFDREKTVILTGTVQDFQWSNPHSWIDVLIADAGAGVPPLWSVECGSPNMMARQGWRSTTLKPGDKVALVVRPMRDGSPVGSLVSITLADGRVLGPGGLPAPATGNAPKPE